LIENGHKRSTFVAASILTLGLLFARADACAAADKTSAAVQASVATPASVSIVQDGLESTYLTRARTVAEYLDERGVKAAPDDYLSVAQSDPIVDGLRIVYRPAVSVQLVADGTTRVIRTAAATIADLLQSQSIALAADDEVSPTLDQQPQPDRSVRIVRVRSWTAEVHQRIAPSVKRKFDIDLAAGVTRTLAPGTPGERVLSVRFVRRDQGLPQRTVLASRILREPRARVIARGISEYATLASYAQHGFESAVHFASAALRMVATAYTAGCYGCSGITRIGAPAGHGIVAVDPAVIPLGTKLYVAGYGRAIAGDTGSAIRGHRIDLGFNSFGEAIRFGRRPITVYVLR
jgi:uncharacterized protein YabE (DUF348 family)